MLNCSGFSGKYRLLAFRGDARNFCLGDPKIQEVRIAARPHHPDKVTGSARLVQVPQVDAVGLDPMNPPPPAAASGCVRGSGPRPVNTGVKKWHPCSRAVFVTIVFQHGP